MMVVDDDRDLADTYALWLQEQCTTRIAYGGEQAREEIDDDVDVVVLDRRMPTLPGDRILAEIRERGLDCPVVMLTLVEPEAEVVERSVSEFLIKPVTKADLLEVIDEVLEPPGADEPIDEPVIPGGTTDAGIEHPRGDRVGNGEAPGGLAPVTAVAGGTWGGAPPERGPPDRADRITDLSMEVAQQVVRASTREEVEESVCATFAGSELYRSAWFGECVRSTGELVPRTGVGPDVPADELPLDSEVENERWKTAIRAAETESVRVDRRADRTVASVPVVYRDLVYGVLTLSTEASPAFGDAERDALVEFSEALGNVINSQETRRLLFSDRAVELELRVTDSNDVLVAASARTRGFLELRGLVPRQDQSVLCYFKVSGCRLDRIREALSDQHGVEHVHGLSDETDEGLLECEIESGCTVSTLVEVGVNVKDVVVQDGAARITAEVAQGTDVERIVSAVVDRFPQTEMVAKRDVESSVQSVNRFRQELENRLTDRQYSVLEATYSGGYFDWPRKRTAQGIAQSMGISQPTLNQHLRAAERKLLSAFFDEVER